MKMVIINLGALVPRRIRNIGKSRIKTSSGVIDTNKEFGGERDYLHGVKKKVPIITTLALSGLITSGWVYRNDLSMLNSDIIPSIYASTSKDTNFSPEINVNSSLPQIACDKSKINLEQICENTLPQDYEMLKSFYQQNKEKFEVKFNGKLDIDNRGNLEYLDNVIIYKPGNALVKYSNGNQKEISSEKLENFLLSSILNVDEMKANNREDTIPDAQIVSLQKKYPKYILDIKEALIVRGIYTQDDRDKNGEVVSVGTQNVLDQRLDRLVSLTK